MPDALIELFSEEIPARMQARAAEDLKRLVTDGLVEAGLTYAHARGFATPRRLALAIEGLSAQSPTLTEERKGPKADAPQKAIDGFLRATGLTLDHLTTQEDKKGAFYIRPHHPPRPPRRRDPGRGAGAHHPPLPLAEVDALGRGQPALGAPAAFDPLHPDDRGGRRGRAARDRRHRAGDTTRGHRFMAPEPFSVTSFEDYAAKLKRAFVTLDPEARAEAILHEAQNRAFAMGLELVEDRALLTEIAGLVEWPVVLVGQIGAEFLDLPPEVLQTSMREHQKFLSLRDPKTRPDHPLRHRRQPRDGRWRRTILAGNQKVLAARLSDAKFFWENDLRPSLRKGLEGMAAGLANVTFHNKLGSQADRIARIEALAREIAPLVGADPEDAAARRPHRQGRPAIGDGRRIPRTARHDGHLLRPRRRPSDAVAPPARPTTNPSAPRTPSPPTPSRSPSRWPTNSTC
jgi:glycyl-tRNA synthetase beta chain